MFLRRGCGFLVVALVACGSPSQEVKPEAGAVASSPPSSPKLVEGMWSDPPVTAIGSLCFGSCTDAAIERLNALLDDPANDVRPFPELQAEAAKHSRDTYLRPRLIGAALKSYPLDPANDPGLLRCEPWGLARQMFTPHQLEIRRLGDDQVAMRYGEWEARRTVYVDGRGRPHDAAPSLLGHSVGRWENETLFIETSGISANITMRFEHSDQLQTTERYTRSEDGQTLWLTATLADPQSLREPLIVKKLWRWAPEAEITPYVDCERPVGVKEGVSP